MSSEEIKTKILDAFTEAFSHGNFMALDAVCAPDMVDHSMAAVLGQPNDLEGFKNQSESLTPSSLVNEESYGFRWMD